MEEPPLTRSKLQQMLQTVVQKFGWTYSIFWKFCPQQGLLEWGDGHYNGSIKTRKTVQQTAVSSEAPPVDRSEQLKELYQFLVADGDGRERRRPDLALSPEDLTECEWFYLMCITFSFAPGCGLPGMAFETQNPIWLTRANDANSNVFSRIILAKSAGIQTVVCIPLDNGALELGTEEMVKEDTRLIQQARNIFADIHINLPIPAALSENSASSPAFDCETLPMNHGMDGLFLDCQEEIYFENEDSNNGESAKCEIKKAFSESEFEIGRNTSNFPGMVMSMAESESIQHGFSDNGFGDSEKSQLKLPEVAKRYRSVLSSDQDDEKSYAAWNFLHDGPSNDPQHSADSMQVTELSPEDIHYSGTVATILQNNITGFLEASNISQLSDSDSSSFSTWYCENQVFPNVKTSQWMLKRILSILPTSTIHNKKYVNSVHLRGKESGGWKENFQDETNGNHVLAERKRREKMNKWFMALCASVPCVTKMNKASILADTVEYVKQLTQRINNLESQKKNISNLLGSRASDSHYQINSQDQRLEADSRTLSASITRSKHKLAHFPETKRLRKLKSTNNIEKAAKVVDDSNIRLQVFIIESTAVIGLQCPYKDGILLTILQKLNELDLDATYINSTMANNNFIAELKAKVKKPSGKRVNAGEIKLAIHQLLTH